MLLRYLTWRTMISISLPSLISSIAALYEPLFLKVPITQRIGYVPADAHQYHVDWNAHPFGIRISRGNR